MERRLRNDSLAWISYTPEFDGARQNRTCPHGILGRAPARCQSNDSWLNKPREAQLVRVKGVMLQTGVGRWWKTCVGALSLRWSAGVA